MPHAHCEVLARCPICHDTRQIPWRQKDGYDLVRCGGCNFIYVRDRPRLDYLKNYYQPVYKEPLKKSGGVLRRLKYWLFVQWVKWHLPDRKKIRVLEFGCGQGDLLMAVQHHPRFEARGIDYTPEPLELARSLGLRVDLGDMESLNFPDASFDLVAGIHVMEHVHDLESTMTQAHRILDKGGLFFAVCPCVTHIKARLAGDKWKYLGPPAHLWYFSPATFTKLLERFGFTVLHASCFHNRAHVRILARKN